MNIRYGTPADATMLAELGAQSFYETFANDNTPENMDAYLRESFSRDIQFHELSQPDIIFLIAESEGTAVGYAQLMMNSREEALRGNHPLELRRIYVSKEQHGKGVGRKLMAATIEEARGRACDSIWLGVWEKNQRAIEFYKKWGFREVGTHIFFVGDDLQSDHVMELELTSSSYSH